LKTEVIKHNDAWAPGVMTESSFDRIMTMLTPN